MTIARQWEQEGLERGIQIGEQTGVQKGRQEGRQEAMQEFALRLLEEKIQEDKIIALTGLSREIIQALKKKQAVH